MDTLDNMKKAVSYIEDNLTGEIDYSKIAQVALCSQYHFQRMFVFLVGVPLSEYIRRRRLTLAAIELQNSKDKVIDIALRYGYSSADAFSRAFQSIHHITPSKAREKGVSLKAYPPISFSLSLKGVQEMNYRIEEKAPFSIIGVKERFSYVEDLGKNVGLMWSHLPEETLEQISELADVEPFGLVGAYSEMYEDNTTDYYIGAISTKPCPDPMTKLEIQSYTWAVFEITGPLPEAMGEIWGRIFSEWFPTTGYEHANAPEVEWYSSGDMNSATYKSEIWIPVMKK
ncbi:Transposon Tn10 TetD protein [compost metagenome]